MWAKLMNIVLGIWLMAAPSVLEYGPAASDNGHIVGPIIVTFSTIAFWESTYIVQKWNYPFALWLLLSPWVLGYEVATASMSDMAVGMMVLVLSSRKTGMKNRYGGGWSSLWEKNPKHMEDQRDNESEAERREGF